MKLSKGTALIDLDPSEFYLGQNYPDPFTNTTAKKVCVPFKSWVRLEVFDSEGRLLKTLLDEEKDAGICEIGLSARTDPPGPGRVCYQPEGVYVYRLEAGGYASTRRMTLRR